jgi:hypothetical protein
MRKIILTLILLVSIAISGFSQYIILPRQGDPIEAKKVFKNDNVVKYIIIKGEDGSIAIGNIIQIIDDDGNEVNINNLQSESNIIAKENENQGKITEENTKREQQRLENLQQQQKEEQERQRQQQTTSETPKPVTERYDLLVTKDAQSIKAVVLEITDTDIKYKKFENQSGPIYSIKRLNIQSIVYSNGEVEVFTGESKKGDISDNICVIETNCGFKVMCYDLPHEMTWMEAQKGCPTGYHLPTIEELECLCKNHSPNYRVGFGFVQIKKNKDASSTHQAIDQREYWSSSTDKKNRHLSITTNDCEVEHSDAGNKRYVRCVKD